MSAIPVRRTTRVVRSTAKDTENANARPSSRVAAARAAAKSTATSTTAAGRATGSTLASKAKASSADTAKETTGAKRKREALVEVGGVSNNKPLGAKGKDGKSGDGKEKPAPLKEKEPSMAATGVSSKKPTSTKPPSKSGVRAPLATIASKRHVRATSVSTTASSHTTTTKTSVEHVEEKMEIDVELDGDDKDNLEPVKEEDEEAEPVSKRRHTEERRAPVFIPPPKAPVVVEDDSQADAEKVAAELVPTDGPSTPQAWDDLDADDFDDPVMVSEYVADICDYLKEIEVATMPNPEYMNEQEEVTWHHRGTLVDWLLQVHARFGLLQESLFLTCNILDRFLSLRTISLKKLQLVGLSAFFIATKYEETYAPSVREIAYLADGLYPVEEILKAEKYMLRILDWDLRSPGPMGWLRRGSKADDSDIHARSLAKYLIEISCVERTLIGVAPSLIAASGLWLARLALGREEWTANLEHYSTYSEEEVIPVAQVMIEYMLTDPVQHESLYKKYAHKRQRRVSVFMRQWCLDRWTENSTVNLQRDVSILKQEIRHYRAMEEAELAAAAANGASGVDNDSEQAV